MKIIPIACATALLLAGCATATYTDKPFTAYDNDTEYAIDERPDGFDITVNYSRYQFVPDTTAIAISCKQALTRVAHDVADKRGRQIAPIDEQRIKLSTGRNIITGITSCSATVPAKYR